MLDLEKAYPGGLSNYYRNALRCLAEEQGGINPYEDYHPKIPLRKYIRYACYSKDCLAYIIDHYSNDIDEIEQIGLEEIKKTVFVLGKY